MFYLSLELVSHRRTQERKKKSRFDKQRPTLGHLKYCHNQCTLTRQGKMWQMPEMKGRLDEGRHYGVGFASSFLAVYLYLGRLLCALRDVIREEN